MTTAGAGSAPAGVSFAGQPYNTWLVTEKADLVSSRSISAVGQFELAGDGRGSALGMNDTFQRALNLLGRAYYGSAGFIGADFAAAEDAKVRTALLPLTRGAAPALAIDRITVRDSGSSVTITEIEARDLLTGESNKIRRLQR